MFDVFVGESSISGDVGSGDKHDRFRTISNRFMKSETKGPFPVIRYIGSGFFGFGRRLANKPENERLDRDRN